MTEPRTAAGRLNAWLEHHPVCPSDITGPCDCGLTAAIEAEAAVTVERLARALHDREARDGGLPHEWPSPQCDPDHYRAEAVAILAALSDAGDAP